MADELIGRLRDIALGKLGKADSLDFVEDVCRQAATRIETLEREIAVMREALEPFAARKTISELLADDGPHEWDDASVEDRIRLMGERKRKNDADILRARQALNRGGAE